MNQEAILEISEQSQKTSMSSSIVVGFVCLYIVFVGVQILGLFFFSFSFFTTYFLDHCVQLCSAVSSKPDCRYRNCEFNPGPVPYLEEIDHEIVPMVILLLLPIQEGL